MQFVKKQWKTIVKGYKHYTNPNDNPSDDDNKAFELLDKAEVDMFIEYCDTHPVNIHVRGHNTVNLLIAAQNVANDTNPIKKLLTQDERIARTIKATLYLIERGIDVNYRDKTGGTALQAAVHWQNYEPAQVLLRKGADPNLGSTVPFLNIPLMSATFKQNNKMIIMLISYGANADQVLKLSEGTGSNKFPLSQQQKKILISSNNLSSIIRRRRYEMALQKKTLLSLLSEVQFQELCFYV